jgi:hypothetical protein
MAFLQRPSAFVSPSAWVPHWGNLFIGGPMRVFSYRATDGTEYTPEKPKGRFRIFMVGNDLPVICLDMGCGEIANQVVARGGHLIIRGDRKAVGEMPTSVLLTSKEYRIADDMLLVLEDGNKLKAIYRHARPEDIPQVLKELDL